MKLSHLVLPLAVLVLVLAPAPPAAAHAEYRSSVPANGATLAASPSRVVITFSQETSATQSQGQVTDARGVVVSSGPAQIDLGDRTKMTIPLKPGLPSGIYTVSYISQSQDTHVVQGSFIFTVAPPAAGGSVSWGLWALAFAAVTALAVGGLVLVRRQTRAAMALTTGGDAPSSDRTADG